MASRLHFQLPWNEIVDKTYNRLVRLGFDCKEKDFKEWMMTKKDIEYPFSPPMWGRCYFISKQLQNDYDHFTVILGKPGLGKSVLGLQVCSIVSPDFRLNNLFSYP